MSRCAANASNHGQTPHGAHANRNQDENPHPVSDQPTSTLAEEGAERNQQAAREDNERTLHGVNGSEKHAETAKNNQNTRPKAASVVSFHKPSLPERL